MQDKISGLVHSDAKARRGENWEGEEVIEVKAFYSANDKHTANTTVVFSESAAHELLLELTYLLSDERF